MLGYSLEEIGGITESTIPAVKAALHRGREGLRAAVQEPDDRPPPTFSEAERARLSAYVGTSMRATSIRFAICWPGGRRLELVNKTRLKGRTEVGRYFPETTPTRVTGTFSSDLSTAEACASSPQIRTILRSVR